VGRDMSFTPPEPGAVTVTAYDANGNVLQVIGPADRGGITATVMIEDAFRSGLTLTQIGDLVLNNTYDGFDRVIQATDALGNYVDTGVGYTSDPFLDPDGRVIRSDSHGPVGGGSSTIVMLASSKRRFDEGGRQYEAEEEVFLANGTILPSTRLVTHTGGGLAANSMANDHTGTVTLTTGGSSYVLTRTVFDPGGRTVATLADNTGQTTVEYDGADRRIQVTDALGNVVANQFDAAGNLVGSTRTEKCTIPGVGTTETFAWAMFYDCLNQLVVQAVQGADGVLNANLVVYSNGPFWQLSGSTLVTVTGYDSRGNRVLSIDPKGNSSITEFDGVSRTIQTQQHLRQTGQGQNPPAANETFLPGAGASVTTTILLDGNGRQTQLIDDRGDITLFEYDTEDREVKMIFHDGSTRTSVYDEADDVVTFTDENGSVFQNTFDALGRKTAVAITRAAGVVGTTAQAFQFDGLSRTTFARDTVGSTNADVTLVYDSLGRVLEDSQAFAGHVRNATNTAFASYPVSGFTFPNGRQIDNTYDLLYRRTQVQESAANIAAWQFFGPSRVAQVQLGNGLISTWMNNAGTRSAAQAGLPTPGWGGASDDRLGYDGSGRMIAKRYLNPSSGSPTTAVVGFTTEYDRSSNKFFERALHAENRSHLYEPFVNQVPQGGYDSLNRLLQYQRGTLDSSGGSGGNGGGDVTTPITLPGTDSARSYLLDGLGNWRNTTFTPVGGSAQTEVRQHNGLNQITRLQNPAAADPLIRSSTRPTTATAT
jgi:YD repeat-containing protein